MAEIPKITSATIKCPKCGAVVEVTLRSEPIKEIKPRPDSELVGHILASWQRCIGCFYYVDGKCDNRMSPRYGEEIADKHKEGCSECFLSGRLTKPEMRCISCVHNIGGECKNAKSPRYGQKIFDGWKEGCDKHESRQ